MTDEQMHEQPEITGIYLLTDREIERIEGKDKDGWGEKKSEGRKDAWDRLMSDRQTDRQIDKHMDHWTDGGLKERKTKRKNWGCEKTRLRNLEKNISCLQNIWT